MKMSAQLAVDENIFLQTVPVASEHNGMSWKLGLGCTMWVYTRPFGFAEAHFFLAHPMLLFSHWQSYATVKPRERGLLAMLKSGETKSLDLWN
jgi:hypothetical protein